MPTEGTDQEVFVEEALVVAALPAAGVEVVEGVPAVLHAVEGGDGLLGAVEGAELAEARLERGARGAAGGRGRRRGGALGEQEGEVRTGGVELAELHCCAPGGVYIPRGPPRLEFSRLFGLRINRARIQPPACWDYE